MNDLIVCRKHTESNPRLSDRKDLTEYLDPGRNVIYVAGGNRPRDKPLTPRGEHKAVAADGER